VRDDYIERNGGWVLAGLAVLFVLIMTVALLGEAWWPLPAIWAGVMVVPVYRWYADFFRG